MWPRHSASLWRSGSGLSPGRHRPTREKGPKTRTSLYLEALEDRCLLSFTLGALVQVAPADPFAGASPGNQAGIFFPNTQVEPRVAVDPTNPNHIVGAWQQDRWDNGGSFGLVAGVSFDAGQTWKAGVIPGLTTATGGTFDRASDPWVSFGLTGTVYVSSLCFDGNEKAGITESAILVNRSTDGGLTWSRPATLIQSGKGILNDKESITADPHNPNLVYVVWDQPNSNFPSSGPVGLTLFSRSTDGGQSWSAPQVIFQSPGNDTSVGHQIVVLPNGTLVDAFEEIHFDPSTRTIGFFLDILRSADGGVTWSQPIVAAQEMPNGVLDPFNRFFVRTGEGLPEIAADPASGNLYAVWEDARFSSALGPTGFQFESIAFSMSTDGGLTWSAPIQINQTPTNLSAPFDSQAFTPSIAVAVNGAVAVSYYDFRFQGTSAGAATDSWAVFGNPKGSGGLTNPANWGNELPLTNRSFNILNAPFAGGWFVGDYEGLAAAGNNFEAFFSQAGAPFPQTSIFARQMLDGPGGSPATPSASPSGSRSAVPAGNPAATSPPLQGSDPSGFRAPVSYAVDKDPDAVAVGDFNNDGIPDLVVANQSSSDVSVLLGNGDGTFQAAKTFAVGMGPQALAVGDFDGDRTLDIVTANSRDITVLFGKGDGTFKNPPVTLTLPKVIANQELLSGLSVAVGDFNHDGKLDVAVTARALDLPKGYLVLFLGNGDGTFQPAIATPINSSSPFSVALADFNGDGNLDVLTGNSMDLVGVPGGGGVSVLLGNGDGTFRETTDAFPGVSAQPMAVAVGDFNNDHIPDLVVTGLTTTLQFAVSVLLGNGNGTFQAPKLFAAGSTFPDTVAVGDFNRDGNLDIVAPIGGNPSFGNLGTVMVFLGNGNGTFRAALNFTSGAIEPTALAVGDFNRDGFPDLAVTDFFSNTVEVLINSGTWPALTTTTTASTTASSQPASTAALIPSVSAPSPAGNRSSAGLFWVDPSVVDQLFASPSAEDRMALWFGAQPRALDGWGDQALSDAFLDSFQDPVRSMVRLR